MKRSRWPHTVRVQTDRRNVLRGVRLTCDGCDWASDWLLDPTISRLTLLAQDHRQANREDRST